MLRFEITNQYKGTGISNGLDRGLLVYQNGDLLLDEGMGMGAVAVQIGGMNYFSSISKTDNDSDPHHIEVTLTVDKMLQRTLYGISSKPLTRFIEKVCTKLYKQREQDQGILFFIGGLINFLFQIKADFVQVSPKGTFQLLYEIRKDEVKITLSGNLQEAADKIFVMNELSGRLFCHGITGGKTIPPPSGWQKTCHESRLYSEERDLSFGIIDDGTSENLSAQLYWGREADKDHCWAGYIYELHPTSPTISRFAYSIIFQEGD